jgi:hypothetical protein
VRYEGPSKAYARRADSGLEIRFYFCPECGTSVYYESDKSPDLCGIAVGCFADPGFPPPKRSVWEESLHPWIGLPTDIVRVGKGIDVEGRPME